MSKAERCTLIEELGETLRRTDLPWEQANKDNDPKNDVVTKALRAVKGTYSGVETLSALQSKYGDNIDPGTLRSLLLPSVGHQLMPSQNSQWVHYLALLYLLLEAGFVPWLWSFVGLPRLVRLRERTLVVEEETRYKAPKIGTIVVSAPSSDMTYNAGQQLMAVFRVRAILALLGAVIINLLAWLSVLGESFFPQGEPSRRASYLLKWAMDLAVLLLRALTEQRPSYMGFAMVMLFVGIISGCAFVLRVLEKLPIVLPYSGTGEGDLPAVMPLLLDVKNTPFAMVSYAWGSSTGNNISSAKDLQMPRAARALAASLPNCWCDVHMMASGSVVPQVTSMVSRSAHLLVLIINASYLRSRNCCIELVAALLHRQPLHVTWAYVSDDVPLDVCAFLSNTLGIKLYTSMAELLEDAGSSVYKTTSPTAVTRLTRWFAMYSEARESVSRNFRLPTPRVRKGGILACSGRLILPRGSVTAGRFYLTHDASASGEHVVLVLEQVLLLVLFVSLVATFLLLRAGYLTNTPIGDTLPQDVPLDVWLPLPIVFCVLIAAIVIVVYPFALNIDVRTHHSNLLLPLCAAAYIQTYEGIATPIPASLDRKRSPASSSRVGSGGSSNRRENIRFLFAVGEWPESTKNPDLDLEKRLTNVIGFMEELGLDASQISYGPMHESALLSASAGLCVCIFVLRTVDDAIYWLTNHRATFALSNTILLVEGCVADANVSISDPLATTQEGGAHSSAESKIPDIPSLFLNNYIYLNITLMTAPKDAGSRACNGFAPMLLDHIGAKIGSAYLSALRKCIRAEAQ